MTQYRDIGFSPQISPIKTIQSYGKSFSFAGSFLSKKYSMMLQDFINFVEL